MNELTVSFQAIYNSITSVLPSIISWIVYVGFLFLSFLIGKKMACNVWEKNIKYHLEKIAKDEIDKRDTKIAKLQKTIEVLTARNKEMYGKLFQIRNVVIDEKELKND